MPYDPRELKEVSDETTDQDPTLTAANTVPGAAETNDKGDVVTRFHPVISREEKTYVRRPESTLDWKNYQFTMTAEDGSTNEFLFTAKDDGDASRKVRERVAATSHTKATYKLVRLDTPKELKFDLSGTPGETVDETDEKTRESQAEDRQKAAAEQDERAEKAAFRARPTAPAKADKK